MMSGTSVTPETTEKGMHGPTRVTAKVAKGTTTDMGKVTTHGMARDTASLTRAKVMEKAGMERTYMAKATTKERGKERGRTTTWTKIATGAARRDT